MKRKRVLLADDHQIILDGLTSILAPEFDIVGAVGDGRSLLAAVEALRPDIVVADISMPLLNGIEAVRQIKKEEPQIKIVILTMHPEVTMAIRALEAGALGYVLKHSASSELITAIHEAVLGHTYITPLIAGELMESLQAGSHHQSDESRQLTKRQREILQLLVEGHSAKEIGAILNLSPRTVEFHKSTLMSKLNLKTLPELIKFAVKNGITVP